MKRAYIRSIVFNILFYSATLIMCVALLPTLFLPRRFYMATVHAFIQTVYVLERFVLGLRYEIRGAEYLPTDGSYILAAKHQSAYETMKLHKLFKDPSIILKKELLSIPLWGMYLKKSDPIAIDRSSPDTANQSIKDGALRMKAQGRPIIIFPQGTRVGVDQTAADKPYRLGVARIQDATDLPIVPMAMNAGLFWPRNSFFKSSGTVVFEFLPPIPAGLPREEVMKTLENGIEGTSQSLMNEARESEMDEASGKSWITGILVAILLLFGLYSALWFYVADQIKTEYPRVVADLTSSDIPVTPPSVTGYPGKITLNVPEEILEIDGNRYAITDLQAQSWPLPGMLISITSGPVEVQSFRWQDPLNFDSLQGDITYSRDDVLSVYESTLRHDDFALSGRGTIDLKQEPIPKFDFTLNMQNHGTLLSTLADQNIIEDRIALFMAAGFASLADENGIVEVPLYQRAQTLYAGPIPIMSIPEERPLRREAITPEAPAEEILQDPQEALESISNSLDRAEDRALDQTDAPSDRDWDSLQRPSP